MGNDCESITSHMGKGQLQHIWDLQTIESDSTNDYTSVIYENCAWHCSLEPLNRPDMTLDVYRGRKTTMQQHRASDHRNLYLSQKYD